MRMPVQLFFVFIFLLKAFKSEEINDKFVSDYYDQKGVRQIAAFGCWNSDEKVKKFHGLTSSNARLSLTEISYGLNLSKILKVNYYKLGVFLELDCPKSKIILDQFVSERLPFNESYFWLLRIDDAEAPLPLRLLDQLPLSVNAEVTLAMNNGADAYDLYDVYNPSYRHGGRLNVTWMGRWEPRAGLANELTQYKYKRRGDLRGMYLNFSIAVNFVPKSVDISTYLTTPIDRHLDNMHRFNYALTLQLRDYYNFTMNLSLGTTWGYLINGTFNGIIGDMIKGIVDVGVTPFQFKPERLDVMEYTVQGYLARVFVIFRHPKKQEMSNWFLEPFSNQVWMLTIIVGLVNWFLLYVTIRVEKFYVGSTENTTLYTQPSSETFLITSAAICQQGLSDTPRVYSGRIVYMSLFLWAMLLYQFYSASIVGSLLAEKPRFIKNIKDLAESSLDVGIEDLPYNYDFFRTTTDKNAIELFRRKIALNKKRKTYPFYKAEEGLRRVQKGNFAFQVDLATAYKIITDTFNEDEICELQEITLFGPKHTSTCTAKHSPFKKMITYGLRQIVEHGMTHHLDTVWKPRKPECPDSHSSIPTPVNLTDFSPALVMISAAAAISIFIMLVENLSQKFSLGSRLRLWVSHFKRNLI